MTLDRVIVQAVTDQRLTTVAWIHSILTRLGFKVDRVALDRVFARELPFYPVSCHSISAPHSSINRRMDCGPVRGHSLSFTLPHANKENADIL